MKSRGGTVDAHDAAADGRRKTGRSPLGDGVRRGGRRSGCRRRGRRRGGSAAEIGIAAAVGHRVAVVRGREIQARGRAVTPVAEPTGAVRANVRMRAVRGAELLAVFEDAQLGHRRRCGSVRRRSEILRDAVRITAVVRRLGHVNCRADL